MQLKLKLIILLLVSYFSLGATYYIDYSTGSDSNNGTTTSTPWKYCPGMSSFSGSYSHSAGDVFVFKGGVTWPASATPLTISNQGSSGSVDTYMGGQRCGQSGSVSCNSGSAWGSGYAVFDGECTGDCSSTYEYAIYTSSSKSYITIDGIKFLNQGFEGRGIEILRGSSWTIKNCYFDTKATYGIEYANSSENASAIYIYNNFFVNNINSIYMLGSDGTYAVDDIKIYNNIIQGLDGTTYTGTIHPDGIQLSGYGEWSWTNVKIYNNQFRGVWNETTNSFIYLQWLNGVQIYNNLFAFENTTDNATDYVIPIGIFIGPSSQHNNNIKIYGNTFSSDANYATNKGLQKAITVCGNSGTVDIQNNIFSNGNWGITLPSPQTGNTVTIDYNLYVQRSGGHLITDYVLAVNYDAVGSGSTVCTSRSWECHGIENAPVFVDSVSDGTYNSMNLALQSTSAAINVGVDLSTYYTTDITGATRTSFDMGAYEYSGGGENPSYTVTVSKSGDGCTLSANGGYSILSGESLNVYLTQQSTGWQAYGAGWGGTCPATGSDPRVATPTADCTVTYTCIPIRVMPWVR